MITIIVINISIILIIFLDIFHIELKIRIIFSESIEIKNFFINLIQIQGIDQLKIRKF
jgi:hypothetical protein